VTSLEVAGVRLATPDGTTLFEDLSFELAGGKSLALTGPSGAGKTSLLAALGLLAKFRDGSYRLDGEDVTKLSPKRRDQFRAHRVGFVFQGFSLLGHLNALDNVAVPLVQRGAPRSVRAARAVAIDALAAVGLADAMRKRPLQLSGGEKQRVAIARAIAVKPSLILADEPTGSLDSRNAELVRDLLLSVAADADACLVVATHDESLADQLDSRVRIGERAGASRGGRL